MFGSDDQKIGNVDEVYNTYLKVAKGFIFTQDLYIPQSFIDHVAYDRVYLSIPKDEVDEMGWDRPPTEAEVGTATRRRTTEAERVSERRMPIREEELQARKHTREAGEVRIGKDVVEEQRTMRVPVTHEEVDVTRRPADRPADRGPQEETMRVPLREEDVSVEKQARVTGELDVRKRQVTEEKDVTGTVRKEVPRVEREDEEKRHR